MQSDLGTGVRVEVCLRDGRTLRYPGCTMDVCKTNELTITDDDGLGDLIVVLGPGTWLAATVYDQNDYPLFAFSAGKGAA